MLLQDLPCFTGIWSRTKSRNGWIHLKVGFLPLLFNFLLLMRLSDLNPASGSHSRSFPLAVSPPFSRSLPHWCHNCRIFPRAILCTGRSLLVPGLSGGGHCHLCLSLPVTFKQTLKPVTHNLVTAYFCWLQICISKAEDTFSSVFPEQLHHIHLYKCPRVVCGCTSVCESSNFRECH